MISRAGRSTRPRLSTALGFSKPTMSAAVGELEAYGLLAADGTARSAIGRAAVTYGLGPKASGEAEEEVDDFLRSGLGELLLEFATERQAVTGPIGQDEIAIDEFRYAVEEPPSPGRCPLRKGLSRIGGSWRRASRGVILRAAVGHPTSNRVTHYCAGPPRFR